MKRTFHLQIEPVSVEMRESILIGATSDNFQRERVEILFANLRKALVIDRKVAVNEGADGAELNRDFMAAWLLASGFTDDEEFTLTGTGQCSCDLCSTALKGAGWLRCTGYRVHWKTEGQLTSVAIFGVDADDLANWRVIRTQDLPRLNTTSDYALLMGWAIDDVIYEHLLDRKNGLMALEDDTLVRMIEQRVLAKVYERSERDHSVKVDWDSRIHRIECRITITAAQHTITAGRQLSDPMGLP